jgi:tRNA(Leu) C34 or U34 (ribose-2'-O)-methylase TrmL
MLILLLTIPSAPAFTGSVARTGAFTGSVVDLGRVTP